MKPDEKKCEKCQEKMAIRLNGLQPQGSGINVSYAYICPRCGATPCFIMHCENKASRFIPHDVFIKHSAGNKGQYFRNDTLVCDEHYVSTKKSSQLKGMIFVFGVISLISLVATLDGNRQIHLNTPLGITAIVAGIITAIIAGIKYKHDNDYALLKKKEFSFARLNNVNVIEDKGLV